MSLSWQSSPTTALLKTALRLLICVFNKGVKEPRFVFMLLDKVEGPNIINLCFAVIQLKPSGHPILNGHDTLSASIEGGTIPKVHR